METALHICGKAMQRDLNSSTEGLRHEVWFSLYGSPTRCWLTKSLAVELGREAITVNCICPGPIFRNGC